MDTALILRMYEEEGKKLSESEVEELLNSSQLLDELTSTFEEKPLFAVWRILALSEVPHTNKLEYTQKVVEYIKKHLATPQGFTLTGKETDLLPCYNAMLLEAFSKLGYEQLQAVQNALAWIKKFQPFERNTMTSWTGRALRNMAVV